MGTPIYVEATSTFKQSPEGQFQAVCCEVVDLGFSLKTYKDNDGVESKKNEHEIQYVFQINKVDEDNGKRYTVRSRPMTLKLSEKANLRKFLLSWRGHDLSEAELKPPGVDIDLTGRNCILSVVHNKSGDKTYANIGSIMPLMEGMPEIQPLDYEPQAEAILKGRAKAAAAGTNGNGSTPTHTGAPQVAPQLTPGQLDAAKGDDDIPF